MMAEYVRTGDALQAQGRYQEALVQYRQALSQSPDYAPALIGLGNVSMAIKHYDDAIEAYLKLLAVDPDNGIVHHNLGEAYQNQSRLKEAEYSYLEALRLCPERPEPYINLGRVLQKQGRLQEALARHRKALSIDPRSGAAHHNIALCLYDDRDLDPALSAFRIAIDLDPSNALACCFLGILYLQKGEAANAESYLEFARQSPFTASLLQSYRYTTETGSQARYFSTTSQILNYAVDSAALQGLFLEFGVCYGASITLIANRVATTVHGFDSFEGLPEAWDPGSGGAAPTERAGSYSTGGSPPRVPDNVLFHVGLFEDTLPGFVKRYPGPVSFMNVDCDLYSSTRTVFDHLGERIVPGSVIVFDEYFCYPEWRQHEYKAFQEFVAEYGIRCEYLAFSFFTGQAVVRIL